jgi:GNAT superfamily N-acetyltransferase
VSDAPDAARLFRVLEATWRAASLREDAGWTLREGAGGGSRVSAGTAGPGARAQGAPPLVQVRPWDGALDAELAALGYRAFDESVLYLASAERIAGAMPHASVYWSAERLAVMEEIWQAGGTSPARLGVMDRAPGPKTFLLCRAGDRAAGTGFAVIAEGVAMVHAIEVLAELRRKGVARLLMRGAASWAAQNGAGWLALAVTAANAEARALYESLGMEEAARYHYRTREP